MTPGADRPTARAEALARLLRQRTEMSGGELFLESLSREGILELVDRVRRGDGEQTVASVAAPEAPGEARPGETGATATRGVEAGPGGSAGADAKVATLDYDELREAALACRKCDLCETRNQVVFSDGARDARLMVVGEAPGAREDESGLPFVGPAGKMLDLLLATVDLSREHSVYICNVIKCRPPGNRNPRSGEIDACAPYLRRQIELVKPGAILAVGTFAGRLLTGRDDSLGRLRGEVYSYQGVPLLVTYHPAALLRNRGWIRSTWDDLQMLRTMLDESA